MPRRSHDDSKYTYPNENTIFLPAAGGRWGQMLHCAGNYGYYWSRTHDSNRQFSANSLYSGYDNMGSDYSNGRFYGLTIRAVRVSQ